MTRDEALTLLTSSSSHDRVNAARELTASGVSADLRDLSRARSVERVLYVRKALDRAIAHAEKLAREEESRANVNSETISDDFRQAVRAQSVKWAAGMILHEIAQPIGLVDMEASREIVDYENSQTRKRILALQTKFEAIEHLQLAATPPRPEEFDLHGLIEEVIFEEKRDSKINISLHGRQPFNITTDPRLLRCAICNGVRNALEAVASLEGPIPDHPIVISWDATDIDVWLSILDAGPGFFGSIERAFEIGKTSKTGHSGFGLAIARQAMESLGGTVTIYSTLGNNTQYELRWSR